MNGTSGTGLWTAAPISMAARTLLAFLATAGIFYVNILPAIVDGLIEGLSFTARHAGQVASANLYGAATGAFLVVLIVKRINWRTWLLHYSSSGVIFMLANCIVGITWAFVMSYLLGLVSEFDKAGQMAAMGGFASKMGLASGPLAGGYLLHDNNYELIINVAIIALALSMAAALIPARLQDDSSSDA